MDVTKNFILCQIQESLERNKELNLSQLPDRILLYNSLIALIVLPVEEARRRGTKKERNPLFKKSFSDLKKTCDFSLELFEPIEGFDRKTRLLKYCKKDTYAFARKLRNAIAHQNVRFDDQEGSYKISFFNLYTTPYEPSEEIAYQLKQRNLEARTARSQNRTITTVEDFRIVMSFDGLRELGNWIGSEYLRALQFKPTNKVGNEPE